MPRQILHAGLDPALFGDVLVGCDPAAIGHWVVLDADGSAILKFEDFLDVSSPRNHFLATVDVGLLTADGNNAVR